jgi:hypothetical protein
MAPTLAQLPALQVLVLNHSGVTDVTLQWLTYESRLAAWHKKQVLMQQHLAGASSHPARPAATGVIESAGAPQHVPGAGSQEGDQGQTQDTETSHRR